METLTETPVMARRNKRLATFQGGWPRLKAGGQQVKDLEDFGPREARAINAN